MTPDEFRTDLKNKVDLFAQVKGEPVQVIHTTRAAMDLLTYGGNITCDTFADARVFCELHSDGIGVEFWGEANWELHRWAFIPVREDAKA